MHSRRGCNGTANGGGNAGLVIVTYFAPSNACEL
jgi:hypothetical protein